MKKTQRLVAVLLSLAMALSLTACEESDNTDYATKYGTEIQQEMKGSFDFLWQEADTKEGSPTYGLIRDRWPTESDKASIASVGFGLAGYVVGVEEGYVTKAEAEDRTKKLLQTLLALQENPTDPTVTHEGMFAHFITIGTGARHDGCEISTIDTALMLAGALTAAEYFGGEIKTLANRIYANVNWKAYENTKNAKKYLSMGYDPESQKLLSNWDWYAEQLVMYILGAGSPTEEYRLDDKTYYDFTRKEGTYNGKKFIYSWFGSIFTYQFSHAFINFKGLVDKNGTDWHENSVQASKAAYEFCQDRKNVYKSFEAGGWGLTACDTKYGYSGKLGAIPRGWSSSEDPNYSRIEGTVAPCGAIGSVVFTPKESLEAMKYYQSLRMLNGKYGLADAFNLDSDFYATDYIGIDKGISLLMLANYKSSTIWNNLMKNENIKMGLQNLSIVTK